uniref:outer mitochondrial transmembrane helix translocase-like n=1 Tax=Myxine glutinosa TaxID=7769 RepID=UPI00358F84F7
MRGHFLPALPVRGSASSGDYHDTTTFGYDSSTPPPCKGHRDKLSSRNANMAHELYEPLNEYETVIVTNLVDPVSMSVAWSDIAGLDSVVSDLRDTVILPIQKCSVTQQSALLQPPKGVLLFGPPGCGKTLMARATARESRCRFINLEPSTLTDKWYGESQKLTVALFSLALKLQPMIIFIDEIDTFLRCRSSLDHAATAMMKAQSMVLWDGLTTDHGNTVVVFWATNRPQEVDPAIVRRLPQCHHIPAPGVDQHLTINKLVLKDEDLDDDVSLSSVAMATDGWAGSDLRPLCREAAVSRLRNHEDLMADDVSNLQPIGTKELNFALNKMIALQWATRDFSFY